MRNWKDSKILYMVFSVLVACMLWMYVVEEVNPDANTTVNNVPILITGTDVLDTRSLMVMEQNINNLDLRISGKRNSLINLTNENITVTADVSSISQPGTYELKCNIILPSSVSSSNVTIRDRDNFRVEVTVQERVSKTIEIRGDFTGSVAEGYQAERFIFSPASIEVTGPADVVDQIDHALVTLSVTDLRETYTGNLPFELMTGAGSVVPSTEVEMAVDSIYVVYPVVVVKEVPLTVEFTDGGGATEDNVTYTVKPMESIQISGEEDDVAGLNEIILGNIDLTDVGTISVFTFPINLSNTLTNESGITEATVTVKVEGLTQKSLETTRVELINVPEGYEAEAVTQSLMVTIRGTEEAVEDILPHQIRVVADLSDVSLSEGQFRVAAKVYIDGAGEVGVLGSDYTISVSLTR